MYSMNHPRSDGKASDVSKKSSKRLFEFVEIEKAKTDCNSTGHWQAIAIRKARFENH